MIYLKAEKQAFKVVKERFNAAYLALLEKMYEVSKAKGEVRDVGSPIHHRMSPISMLTLAQAKCRRIESLLSQPGWETKQERLEKTIEECTDIANYALFIAALCSLLAAETEE